MQCSIMFIPIRGNCSPIPLGSLSIDRCERRSRRGTRPCAVMEAGAARLGTAHSAWRPTPKLNTGMDRDCSHNGHCIGSDRGVQEALPDLGQVSESALTLRTRLDEALAALSKAQASSRAPSMQSGAALASVADLTAKVTGCTREQWTQGRTSSGLGCLHLRRLIERIPRTRRQRVIADASRTALYCDRAYARVPRLAPSIAFDVPGTDLTPLQRAGQRFDGKIQRLRQDQPVAACTQLIRQPSHEASRSGAEPARTICRSLQVPA